MKKLHVALDDGWGIAPEVLNSTVRPAGETNSDDHEMKVVIAFNPDGIPAELKALPQWVGWQFEPRGTGKKPAKVPLDPRTGGNAKANKPKTWGTFDQAMLFHEERGCPGVGFFFDEKDPYVGIDLDGCRDPETGDVDPWALEIVQRCDSFTEVSASGKGLHIVVKGELPGGGKNRGGIEMYDDRRFFAMTGVLLPETNPTIEDRQDVVLDLYSSLQDKPAAQPNEKGVGEQAKKSGTGSWQTLIPELQQAELTPAGEEILRALAAGQFGELYRRLYVGDLEGVGRLRRAGPYWSDSEADMAMINFLYKQTGGNPGLVYAIYKETTLGMRDKADRLDYVARTIQKAIDGKDWPDGHNDGQMPHLQMVTDAWEPEGGPEGNHGASAEEEAGWPGGSPAGAAGVGCTPHTTCGPPLGEGERWFDPQAISGFGGSPSGLWDEAPSQESLNNLPLYKEGAISPSISPRPEASASAQTKKTSMAAMVREIALATPGEFTVGEIALAVVKSQGISPFPTTDDEWKPWLKLVSNALNRLVKEGLLVRVKKGVYLRANLPQVDHQVERQTTDCINQDGVELLRKYKDKPGEAGQFLEIPTPLGLDGYLKFPKGGAVVIAGVISTAKTIKGMQWAAALRKLMKVYYFQTELSREERAGRRSNLEAHLGLPHGTLEDEIEWIRPRSLNVLDDKAMDELARMILPGAAVFVDYLQISDKFYRIGDVIPKLARNIGDGLLVIFVQKDRNKPTGRGDSHLEEFPRVVLTLDPVCGSDDLCVLRFRKWKAKAKPGIKLSNIEILYRINETGTAVVPIKERPRTPLFPQQKGKSEKNKQPAPPADHKKASESESSEGGKTAKVKETAGSSE